MTANVAMNTNLAPPLKAIRNTFIVQGSLGGSLTGERLSLVYARLPWTRRDVTFYIACLH